MPSSKDSREAGSPPNASPKDLVLTDVTMPGMAGTQLVEILKTLYPSVKVVFVSAYAAEGVIHARDAFLQKPYSPDVLKWFVRGVLDGEG